MTASRPKREQAAVTIVDFPCARKTAGLAQSLLHPPAAEGRSIIRLLTRTTIALFVLSLVGSTAAVDAVEPSAGALGPVCGDPLARTELFFGAAKPDGSAVTDDEFATFIEEEVTPRFPDGLTLLVGSGQFKNGGAIVRERSFVLILLHHPGPNPESSADVEAIRRAYKVRFAQHSVLRIDSQTTRVCF